MIASPFPINVVDNAKLYTAFQRELVSVCGAIFALRSKMTLETTFNTVASWEEPTVLIFANTEEYARFVATGIPFRKQKPTSLTIVVTKRLTIEEINQIKRLFDE